MGVINWFKKKLFGVKRGYAFTDDDRQKSRDHFRLNQQLRDIEWEKKLTDKHIEIAQSRIELKKLQDELLEFDASDDDPGDDDHDSWTNVFKGLLKNPTVQNALLQRLGNLGKPQDPFSMAKGGREWWDYPIQDTVVSAPQSSTDPVSQPPTNIPKELLRTFASWAEDNEIPDQALLDLKERLKF